MDERRASSSIGSAPKAATASGKARVLFACLLVVQAALALIQPPSPFVGDEPYYVAKARYLFEHHRFAPAATAALAAERGQTAGTSDWRPQGYPLFVALCSLGDFDAATLRSRVTIVQFLLLAAALWWLFLTLCRFTPSPRRHFLIAVLLAGLPWPFEFVSLIGADSLTVSLFLFATLLLWRRSFVAGSLLASATFLLRPEMIVLVPVVVGTAVLLEPRRRVRHALLTALAFFAVIGLQVSYRVWFTGEWKPSIFGGLHIVDRGAFAWVHTWLNTENEAYDFVYGLTNGRLITKLPDRAFADKSERDAVTGVLQRVRKEGYSTSADAVFASVAEKRRREAPIRNVVIPRLWRTVHLWVNVETNSQLLHALAAIPRPVRRALLGMLLLLKIALVLAFPFAAVRRFGRDDLGRLVALMAVVVVSRTLLIGMALNWMAHRYMLVAWPHLLGVVSAPRNEATAASSDGVSRHDAML
ncbi:MAG TPA: hypothetical protein VF618_27950 [Thermoanaerobaculia bacterium]